MTVCVGGSSSGLMGELEELRFSFIKTPLHKSQRETLFLNTLSLNKYKLLLVLLASQEIV